MKIFGKEPVPEKRTAIELSGRDCAIVMREDGLVEMAMKTRAKEAKYDLTDGELFMVALNSLMKDRRWVDMVMNVDYPNFADQKRR